MRLKFDANQEFQIRAIEAVTDLFEGQARMSGGMRLTLGAESVLAAVPNRLDLDEAALLQNLRQVQARNRIAQDDRLLWIEDAIETAAGERTARFANFSVEMETGTGKTYVYLRTALELYTRYGMRKFIVVVPSVAIREGVKKTLQITEDHFRRLYDNPVYRYYVYDSASLTQVRHFATADSVEIMVMTIDSFNKAANVIRQSTDRLQGETPIHLVQAARPILILDEPQNMESDKRVAALATLDPLFALRYSATHRNPYNVIHRLTPAEAYGQGLVKRVEVDSVVRSDDANRPYIRLEDIQVKGSQIKARLRVHKLMKSGVVKETSCTVKPDDSLHKKANRREYAGYEIAEISPGGQFVLFANQVELSVGEEFGADKEAIFDVQIRNTLQEHFRKQRRLRAAGIKVLSLFFIDRVDNYARKDGVIRRLFDRAFDELKQKHADWKDLDADAVQAAYFAQKRRRTGQIELLDSTEGGDKKEDQVAYDLIMRDKESLLSFPAPDDDQETRRKRQVAFIFSHSALREGWDNPNVFQICTLNQTASITKKRQEVGRGVRLAVDQEGNRVRDDHVNVLTVVANESYRDYVENYQSEIAFEYRAEIEARYGKPIGDLSDEERRKIEDEYGEGILPPPPRQARRRKAKLRKARLLKEDFRGLWQRIKHKTWYAVKIDTEQLLADLVPAIDGETIAPPRVTITKAAVTVSDDGIFDAIATSGARAARDLTGRYPLPNLVDVMTDLLEHTSPPVRVTRATLLELFRRVQNKHAAVNNPHGWATLAVRLLKEKLADHLVGGIEYTRVCDTSGAETLPEEAKWYRMSQILDDEQIELFAKHIVPADQSKDKTVYDLIPCGSEVEKKFVRDLEARTDVRLYVKLPYWFSVPTPVGDYNPDWAIVMDGPPEDGKPVLYLVSQTKSAPDGQGVRLDQLRPQQRRKILCGAAHFGSKQLSKAGALEGVEYKVLADVNELP